MLRTSASAAMRGAIAAVGAAAGAGSVAVRTAAIADSCAGAMAQVIADDALATGAKVEAAKAPAAKDRSAPGNRRARNAPRQGAVRAPAWMNTSAASSKSTTRTAI